jgi:hypothetical protein
MAESVVAPQVVEPVSSWRNRLIETLNTPQTLRFIFPATSFLLLFSVFSWLVIERDRLNEGLGRTNAQLSEQQRREQGIADLLAAEREQSGKLKSELDRLRETVPPKPSRPQERAGRPSFLSFFLEPALAPRGQGEPLQQIKSHER